MRTSEQRELFNRAAALFLKTIDQPAEQRQEFLDSACGHDQELRKRVSSLLAQHDKGSVLEEPKSTGPLSGEQISRYRILGKVGEGGMSVVYRAEDQVLDRVVALKFLAPHLANNPDAVKRFEREAKAAAALDHPNVCPVYEIDRAGERVFIAMTFQEGKTLAEMLHRGPLEVEAAIDIAVQTCRGLAAAHSKHIVHRDIKPANLMVTEATGVERLVRILDFGIARLSEKPEHSDSGLAMGTVSYMSPEQIQDGDVDGRADLWALGVVIYRMIAGELPFQGNTTAEVLSAIASAEPEPLTLRRREVLQELSAIVTRLLRKDPNHRYQSADELLPQLERLLPTIRGARQLSSGLINRSERARGKRRWLIKVAAGALVLVAALALIQYKRSLAKLGEPPKAAPFTSYVGSEDHPAISPDGTRIAFIRDGESASAQKNDIYVQAIGSQSAVRLTDTPESEHSPVWSPDGTRIAFLRQFGGRRKVLIVPAQGGQETEVGEISGIDQSIPELDWSSTGDCLAAETTQGIVRISLADFSIRRLSFPPEGTSDSCPRFDPSGRRLAFLRNSSVGPDTYQIMPAEGGTSRSVKAHNDLLGDWSREFTWNRDGTALIYPGPSVGPGGPLHQLLISDGTVRPLDIEKDSARSPKLRGSLLAYTRRELNTNLWALDLSSFRGSGDQPAAVRLIASSLRQDSPQFSADGRYIVFSSDRGGSREIWRSDRDGGNLKQLTSIGGKHAGSPRWSPDGGWIAFDATIGSHHSNVYVVSSEGGVHRKLMAREARLPSWSQDGRWIYFTSADGSVKNIWKIRPEGSEAVQVTQGGGWECFESPDGHYLYYSEMRGQIHRLDLRTGKNLLFPELSSAGRWRYWAPARLGIYFVDRIGEWNWVQFLNVEDRKVTKIGKIGNLLDGPSGLAVSPDERTLLFAQRDKDDRDIMLVRLP